MLTLAAVSPVLAADVPQPALLDKALTQDVQPLLKRVCHKCHGPDLAEAELDLTEFKSLADVRKGAREWLKVRDMLDSGQMPPPDAPQLSAAEQTRLSRWVHDVLALEAAARAGDPGPVALRRLSNAEYTYSLRDLTGVAALDPAKEFPVDGAAGEGFTNVGQALVMSPALVQKYLDAGKGIAGHAVLLPDGIRFSPSITRRDWTNEGLARIREFYARYSTSGGGTAVNLQGIRFDTNQGGRLPIEQYLAALLESRTALASGQTTIDAVARKHGLSPKYLGLVWQALANPPPRGSWLIEALRTSWQTAQPGDAPALAQAIAAWQGALWKLNSVGYIGLSSGPKAWQEPVVPLTARQELRFKVPATADDVVLSLSVGSAGDGRADDFAVWERPRFVAPGRPDLLVRDVRRAADLLITRRDRYFAETAVALAAAAEVLDAASPPELEPLAAKHKVSADSLRAWLGALGLGTDGAAPLGARIEKKGENNAGYDFIKSWYGDEALSIIANSSDQRVLIPGTMPPHSIAVHPTPSRSVVIGWRSPVVGTFRVTGVVQDAHTACGNGVGWAVELRRGSTRQRLAGGATDGDKEAAFGPFEDVAIRKGDVVALVINPRDASHVCDLTRIDLTLKSGETEWNLSRDVSSNLLAGNPHADSRGTPDVWHFCWEAASNAAARPAIPAGSLLAKWQRAAAAERPKLAADLQKLLQEGAKSLPADSPDAELSQQWTSLQGPLMAAALQSLTAESKDAPAAGDGRYGLAPALFGKHPNGTAIDDASLCVQAPAVLELRVPAALVEGAELVTGATLHAETGRTGSVQFQVGTTQPAGDGLLPQPIVVADGGPARARWEQAFADFRNLFPPALCYTKIVPVDEVVTLNIFYREDDQLRRLMLTDAESAELERMWDELLFVAREPLEMVTAFEQLVEFATQDNANLVKILEPHRPAVHAKAAAYRQRLRDVEPSHVEAVVRLAAEAYRRPLTADESAGLRSLYATLRTQEIPHDDAIRLTLARVFVSPEFLYKSETAPAGDQPGPVSDRELAVRLSYFLWSSQPDAELRELAEAGRLHEPEVLVAQTRRMLRDGKVRRLATEFACRWLHIYDFDQLDEKSERHFPTFAALRGAMYEESILFFTDLFQHDRPTRDLLDADATFLNEDLAKHYGIPGVTGQEWRRVEGVRKHARGGILTQAATLAKQSGASRTSPILRGNWLSEVVLGEKLPRPPKNVPPLADAPPEGLTERQLTELHSREQSCAKCHARIDPFGFALERFDAIGRYRDKDAAGLAIDTKTKLPDGTALDGLDTLRTYLLTTRRDAVARQFHRKLLGYALGRSVQLSDEPLLSEMAAASETRDTVGAAIEAIVLSPQFRQIRGRDASAEE